ncbi:hypothetical protein K9L05_03830 [Candidatus Babeliales bacterium]|nr:hypothetical protein [Candidatus Babeliales bacterium]MCF7899746.1 hypothetical protein [Candidatus Babeliales bacterium]
MKMVRIMHQGLYESGRWFKLSLEEQLANIGADIGRAIQSRAKGDAQASGYAFERALELIDFTIDDPKNIKRLKEVVRVREFLVDYFVGDNQYGFTDKAWQDYFYYFGYIAAAKRGR